MTRFITAIAAVTTLIAAPAYATDPVKEGKDPMAQRVCVVTAAKTGTLIEKRQCKTRAEWISETGVDPLKK